MIVLLTGKLDFRYSSTLGGNVPVDFGSITLACGSSGYSAACASSKLFAAKLSSSGEWLWATYSTYGRSSGSAAATADGGTLVAGEFSSYSYAQFGSTRVSRNGDADSVVAKVGADGAWEWVMMLGGPDDGSGASADMGPASGAVTTTAGAGAGAGGDDGAMSSMSASLADDYAVHPTMRSLADGEEQQQQVRACNDANTTAF